jgi:hypothetical protein
MRFSVRRRDLNELVPATIVETERGVEVRGEHLLGIVNPAGQFVVKLRDEFLIVEDEEDLEA